MLLSERGLDWRGNPFAAHEQQSTKPKSDQRKLLWRDRMSCGQQKIATESQ